MLKLYGLRRKRSLIKKKKTQIYWIFNEMAINIKSIQVLMLRYLLLSEFYQFIFELNFTIPGASTPERIFQNFHNFLYYVTQREFDRFIVFLEVFSFNEECLCRNERFNLYYQSKM